MARKAKRRAPRKPVRRRRSRLEQERRMRLYIIWGTIVVGVLSVGLITYGLASEAIRTSRQMREPFAVVNGVEITLRELRDRAHLYEALAGSMSPEIVDYAQEALVEEELVRQEAAERGITVTPAEVQDRLERRFNFHRTPPTSEPTLAPTATVTPTEDSTPEPTAALPITPTVAPTPVTEEGFEQLYAEQLEQLGTTDETYRSLFKAELLREKLVDEFAESVEDSAEQVQLRYLQVYSDAQASDLFARLDAGEADFETLQAELEADDAPGYGFTGEAEWYTEGMLTDRFSEPFAEQAMALESGVFIQPVISESGATYYVVEVLAREEREVDETMRDQLARQAYSAWLEEQKASVEYIDYDLALLIPDYEPSLNTMLGQ